MLLYEIRNIYPTILLSKVLCWGNHLTVLTFREANVVLQLKATAAWLVLLYPLTHTLKEDHCFFKKGNIIMSHYITIYINKSIGSLRTHTLRVENPEGL